MPARVGLTGGIGSGKSTVAGLFARIGVTVIDADKIARDLTQAGTDQYLKIIGHFGQGIVDTDRSIDRARLGSIVFSDERERKWLEDLLHPPIRQTMQKMADAASGCYCILEIPLLMETGQWREMDRVLVVTCDEEIRIQRLMESRAMEREQVQRILDAQMTDTARSEHAHDVIDNNGSLADLTSRVDNLNRQYNTQFCD